MAIRLGAAAAVAAMIAVVFSGVAPMAAAEEVALAQLSSADGSATLFYDPSSKSYSVSWVLNRGVQAQGEILGKESFIVETALWNENGDLIGCYTSGDASAASGTQISGENTINLVGCTENGIKFIVAHEPTNGHFYWGFFGGFVSVAYSADTAEDLIAAIVGATVGIIAGVTVGILCEAGTFGLGTPACIWLTVAVGEVVGNGVGMVVEWLDPWCDGEFCTQTVHSTIVSSAIQINGIPTITSWFPCSPAAPDTWNIVEDTFYNRPPGQGGIGVTYPYGAGQACLDVDAQNSFLGVGGTISDAIDMALRMTIVSSSLPGDGPNARTAEATDVHTIEFASVPVGNVGAYGSHKFRVSSQWDLEWKGEPTGRGATATDYQYVLSPKNADCGNCDTSVFNPMYTDFEWQHVTQGFLASFLLWDGLDDIEDTNIMHASATSKGLIATREGGATANPSVRFELIPRIDCAVNCGGGGDGGNPLDKIIDLHGAPTFFLLSDSREETISLVERVRELHGDDQHMFVLTDTTGTDWEAYGRSAGYQVIDRHAAENGNVPGYPLITIVEGLGANILP